MGQSAKKSFYRNHESVAEDNPQLVVSVLSFFYDTTAMHLSTGKTPLTKPADMITPFLGKKKKTYHDITEHLDVHAECQVLFYLPA